MHLRSHLLPRPSASSPLDDRAYPTTNTSQAQDLEGLHREIYGMAEQMRIMNKNNVVLIQHLAANNPPPPPPTPRVERSGDEGGLLAVEIRSPDTETDPPLKKLGTSTPILTPSIQLPTQLKIYEGKTDPMDHLDSYKSLMAIQGYSDGVMCKAFSATLKEVEDPSDKVVIMAMMEGLHLGPLFDSLSKNVPETLLTLQSKADKYIVAEKLAEAKWKRRGREDKRKEPETKRTNYRNETRNKRLDRDLRPTAGDIQVIHGGFGSEGCLSSSRKRHARSAIGRAKEEVYNLSSPSISAHLPITFTNDDLRGLHLPHDDALVISIVIANFNLQRILVDNGSSVDILFISAFEKMKIGLDKLHPFHTPLVRFGGNTTYPLGLIKLPVTLGTKPHQTTIWKDFIIVDCSLPYNAILGHPALGGIRAITSTYHLKMKFLTSTGIGKASVITERRLYCYKVMSFGLKNVGAIYQRLVNKMFRELIGKTMEVYIDDMLVKSLKAADHIAYLEEAFDILRKHRMMLNPSKCIFGVFSGKFLEFLVTKRGIEVNPDQIQALLSMSSPRNIREVQQLTGQVAALNRFVSKSADKCLPFFKILRKNQAFQWNDESERLHTSGKLLKWSIELSEFHIDYKLRMAIKGQALDDILAEFTYDIALEPDETLPDVENP
ncbi:hypothetical protein Acr_18g0009870 [Actinidia rufa]|uniref:Reverse transcriptase domain-containing protein n=1 Tax=Actinidia rufa TaxID=165716 RepID=A0A7J0G7P9_9ERIC|nr:hypothetical protein Acr_18g0009870 [Actinidia rufa]